MKLPREGLYYMSVSNEFVILRHNTNKSIWVYTCKYKLPLYPKVFTNLMKAWHGKYFGRI